MDIRAKKIYRKIKKTSIITFLVTGCYCKTYSIKKIKKFIFTK